ncbi:MAG: hypothetical protein WDO17_20620 [Alphaproteobacteria bacterium]
MSHDTAVTNRLRALTSSDLAGLTSEETALIGEIKAYLEWLDDRRPEVAVDEADKFAGLIVLSRHYQQCNRFYLDSVGVSDSTVWRWAHGKSRPSRYVGERIAADVKSLVAESLWQRCKERHLTRPATAAMAARAQPA